MLKKFTTENYRNFKNKISIDFQDTAGYQFGTDCITDGMISKMLIYGRNATGKTNLGKAFMDINVTLFGRYYRDGGIFLNADSSGGFASFCYEFQIDNNDIIYRYDKSSNLELCKEELIINGITIFQCDFLGKKYNFDHLKYINAETANVERYLESLEVGTGAEDIIDPQLPFFRWIIGNVALKNDSLLIKMSDYVRRMVMMTVSNTLVFKERRLSDSFFELLENPESLKDFEDFLNAMGITCKLVLKKLPDGQGELYFAHEKLVPFYENASSGTLTLASFYRRFITAVKNCSFMYLDEFDAFYHYEMADNVIRFLKLKYPMCQIIMTSHNTNLMTNRLMRPDCLFILSRKGTLTALCNATPRELREGHNLEKMYISGEFESYE